MRLAALILGGMVTCATVASGFWGIGGPPAGWFDRVCTVGSRVISGLDLSDPARTADWNAAEADEVWTVVDKVPDWDRGRPVLVELRAATHALHRARDAWRSEDRAGYDAAVAEYRAAAARADEMLDFTADGHGHLCEVQSGGIAGG